MMFSDFEFARIRRRYSNRVQQAFFCSKRIHCVLLKLEDLASLHHDQLVLSLHVLYHAH